MDLRQIEYFCKVSALRSFTKAAAELHVAQPSITNAIHKLEDELGLQLFDRSQRKVILTPEGQAFLRRGDRILFEVRQALAEMADFQNLNKGAIKFAVPPMIGAYLFPNIFTRFQERYSNIALEVWEAGSMASRTMLEQEELDLGLIILPQQSDALDNIPLVHEQIMLCVAPGHRLRSARQVDFSDLREESFIMFKKEFLHHQLILDECTRHKFTPRIVFTSNQLETVKALTASNIGISFLMNMVVQQHPVIVSIPLSDPIRITIGLAWKKGRYLSKAALAFIEFLRAYAKELPTGK